MQPSMKVHLLAIYASDDAGAWTALQSHLSSLRAEGFISDWSIGGLLAGEDIARTTTAQVEQADLVLLLLSASFLASASCQTLLVQVQAERTRRPLRLVPVLVRPVDWQGSGVKTLQPLPRNGVPVHRWPDEDAAWLDVVEGLRQLLGAPAPPSLSPPALPPPVRVAADPTEKGPPMSNPHDPSRTGAVHIGGSLIGGAVVTGHSNTVTVAYHQTTLPPPETVDLRTELAAIRQLLSALSSEDRRRMERALEEATEEAERSPPRKEVIGESVEKALTIATKTAGFLDVAEKLRPHINSVTAWLGAAWHKLLPLVGNVL